MSKSCTQPHTNAYTDFVFLIWNIFNHILRNALFINNKKELRKKENKYRNGSTTKRSMHNCYVRMNNCSRESNIPKCMRNMNDSRQQNDFGCLFLTLFRSWYLTKHRHIQCAAGSSHLSRSSLLSTHIEQRLHIIHNDIFCELCFFYLKIPKIDLV